MGIGAALLGFDSLACGLFFGIPSFLMLAVRGKTRDWNARPSFLDSLIRGDRAHYTQEPYREGEQEEKAGCTCFLLLVFVPFAFYNGYQSNKSAAETREMFRAAQIRPVSLPPVPSSPHDLLGSQKRVSEYLENTGSREYDLNGVHPYHVRNVSGAIESRTQTFLYTAVSRGDSELARRLVDAGADISIPDGTGKTPGDAVLDEVSAQIRDSRSVDTRWLHLLSLFLESGYKISPQKDGLGLTLLHRMGSIDGDVKARQEIMKQLVTKLGWDVNQQDDYGWTPLFAAALQPQLSNDKTKEQLDIVKLLLELGADPSLKLTKKSPRVSERNNHPIESYLRYEAGWTVLDCLQHDKREDNSLKSAIASVAKSKAR